MKRISSLIITLLMVSGSAMAQYVDDNMLFNHLGVGVSFGLDGIGIEASTTATKWAGIRAGISFYPTLSYSPSNINYTRNGKKGELGLDVDFKKVDGKILIDGYPFGDKSSFHVTAGLFFGNREFLSVNMKEDPNAPINGSIIPSEGNPNDYFVDPDENGIIKLRMTYNSVKPYLGIGFGRAVPKAGKRVAVAFDLGVQFHGSPKVEAYSPEGQGWLKIKADDFSSLLKDKDLKDVEDAFDLIDKLTIWPVLNVRITGRIF